MNLQIHIDGGARGNPGPAAIGVTITDSNGSILCETSQYIGIATSNVAEYKALIKALQIAKELQANTVKIHTDSQLVAKQLTGEWAVRDTKLIPLHKMAKNMPFTSKTVHLIPRERNTRADQLVNRALDSKPF